MRDDAIDRLARRMAEETETAVHHGRGLATRWDKAPATLRPYAEALVAAMEDVKYILPSIAVANGYRRAAALLAKLDAL